MPIPVRRSRRALGFGVAFGALAVILLTATSSSPIPHFVGASAGLASSSFEAQLARQVEAAELRQADNDAQQLLEEEAAAATARASAKEAAETAATTKAAAIAEAAAALAAKEAAQSNVNPAGGPPVELPTQPNGAPLPGRTTLVRMLGLSPRNVTDWCDGSNHQGRPLDSQNVSCLISNHNSL